MPIKMIQRCGLIDFVTEFRSFIYNHSYIQSACITEQCNQSAIGCDIVSTRVEWCKYSFHNFCVTNDNLFNQRMPLFFFPEGS